MAEHVSDANFDSEVIKSAQPVLVDFYAEWCGPCKMLAPLIDELATEYAGKAKIVKINTDDSPETAKKYGIMSIPTLIFFKNGQVVEQVMGVQSKDALKEKLDKLV